MLDGYIAELRDRHEPENFRITPDIRLGYGGIKTKYADNIAAIRLLKDLQARNVAVATPEQKHILVRYVGWGGIPKAFDGNDPAWAKEYRELRDLLSPEEYAQARRTTQDAHYTSETVIRGIYNGLDALGVQQPAPLRILEPSAGIGNFLGLLPDKHRARFLAVEQDSLTAAIGSYLYPRARHLNTGFQHVPVQPGTFDLVIGNPPFGSQSLFDPESPELRGMSIHNYFLAKSIGALREGGIAAFVVSRYFMDAQDGRAREHIARQADLLGAIRLPETAFRQNALTEVTTDIVYFRKHDGTPLLNQDWVNTVQTAVEDRVHGGQATVAVNAYFVQHPEQIIGTLACTRGMYEGALTCLAPEGHDLAQEINRRLTGLVRLPFLPREDQPEPILEQTKNQEFIASDYFTSLKMGAYCVEPKSRKIVFKVSGAFGEPSYDELPVKTDGARQRLLALIQLRDALRELLNAEKHDKPEESIAGLRRQLNVLYDGFVRRHGHVNAQANRVLMRDDPEHSLLESLEQDYDKGVSKELARKHGVAMRPATATKAAIFRQRVLKPAAVAEKAENAKDALVITLRESGKVNLTRIGELLGISSEEAQKELQRDRLIFLNPASAEWEIRDKYLTGNVRRKLREAEQAARDMPQYEANVEALREAMPADIEAVDIGIKFGSPWVPPEVIVDFLEERIHGGRGHQHIDYIPVLGRWEARVAIYDRSIEADVWGIPEYPASKIIESLLANRPIKVEVDTGQRDPVSNRPIMMIDQELTAAAVQKAEAIKREFVDGSRFTCK